MLDLLPDIAQRRKDTPKERAARGKETRKRAPRSAHGAWQARAGRPDPVLLLEEQAAERAWELVPIRYGRMLAQSPERRPVFDINDFDETLPGPWEWDVKRLAVSFEVAAMDRGFDAATRRAIVLTCVRAYRQAMIEMAEKRAIDLWTRASTRI